MLSYDAINKNTNLTMLTNPNFLLLCSPLEQFSVYNFFEGLFSDIPNLVINTAFILGFLFFMYRSIVKFIHFCSNFGGFFNTVYMFLKGIYDDNVSVESPIFFSVISFLFLFIFFGNLVGTVPLSFTITSSLILTLFLSLTSFISILITGFNFYGLSFFSLFLPDGSPKEIAPFLILVEFISFSARLFSLAIRLFANMMAGHILLKIIAGAVFYTWLVLIPTASSFSIFGILTLLLIIALELCIAFLQAYVFVTLICIYVNEAIFLH